MTAFSPDVKDLKLKSHSRYNYYYEWQKSKGGNYTFIGTIRGS